jgi:putative ABC transport system ATP-binding protein
MILTIKNLVKLRIQGGISFELRIPQLELPRGGFIAVVGESGCGKSTLLDLLALVLRPTQSDSFYIHNTIPEWQTERLDIGAFWETGNENALAQIRREKLGYVLQTGGLLPFLSVEQNLLLPCRVKNISSNECAVRALAKRMGVETLLAKKPQFLSGGQRQRVAILRAIIHHPEIILADEPTAAVDRERAIAIVKDFHSLAKEKGCTIVIVTHNRALIEPLADMMFTFAVEQVSDTFTYSVCTQAN